MEFRLYKEPYHEPFFPGKIRLLFESTASLDNNGERGNDLYLYLWIDNGNFLSAFQAVLDEDLVLDFHAPDKLEFSRITAKPIKRSMARTIDDNEKKRFLSLLSDIKGTEFARLLTTVDEIVHSDGNDFPVCDLTQEDRAMLAELEKKTGKNQ